jgi:GTPase Era involved in 16S rRNA processing
MFDDLWDDAPEDLVTARGNPYLQDPLKGLELMARLIAKPAKREETAQKLELLHRDLHDRFLHLCSQENTPNEAELFLQMQKAFKDLEELVDFTALANKNVVAVGGSFSAGKSRFINALIGDDTLPCDTKKTTAIPTHVIRGASESIRAVNTLNNIAELDRDAFKAICHDFNRIYKVGFSHIIKLVTITKPNFPYGNISLLDTPGYSASEGVERGDNTDESIAREHLSQADYLLWVVSAKNGTVPESDLVFLRSLGRIPELFLILNKADLLPPGEDLENVLSSARRGLKAAEIPCAGAAAFNSLKGVRVLGDSLHDYLAHIEKKNKPTMMAKKFSAVFQAFVQHNNLERQQWQRMLGFFNTVQLRLDGSFSAEEREEGKALKTLAQQQSAGLKLVIKDFETLAGKVEKSVQSVMQEIKEVREFRVEDLGIPAICTVPEEGMLVSLVAGQYLKGTVRHSDLLGIFIDFGLGEDLLLYPKKVKERYSCNPIALFPVGSQCRAAVHEVRISERKATLAVIPGHNEGGIHA